MVPTDATTRNQIRARRGRGGGGWLGADWPGHGPGAWPASSITTTAASHVCSSQATASAVELNQAKLDALGWAGLGWAGLGWAGLGWPVSWPPARANIVFLDKY